MLIKSIRMKNFLSYGPQSEALELRPLNVLIGPNGSGKSNFLEGLSLVQATPRQLVTPIRSGGGVRDWLWKGGSTPPIASLEIVVHKQYETDKSDLRYRLDFTEVGKRFEIVDEQLEGAETLDESKDAYFFYWYENNHPVLNVRDAKGTYRKRSLRREDIDPERSILAQRKDPEGYPEITYLGEVLPTIRIYQNWSFGPLSPLRQPQPTDLPNRYVAEDARNVALVLSRLRKYPEAKRLILEAFKAIYAGAEDFDIQVEGGTVQLYVQEAQFSVPATRLSDGTLRYLTLLAILYDPKPPPLICIDEPELGLHPDLINQLAIALRSASERTQVIITTHSVGLVDSLTDDPESIVVCERVDGCTQLHRLSDSELEPWLEDYRLGELWSQGEIGGNRW